MTPTRLFLLLPALALGAGCASECGNPAHFNGDYDVFSSATPDDAASTNTAAMMSTLAFYNGRRDWELRYVDASGAMRLLIDGQELSAAYTEDPENCNRFTLTLDDATWQDSETVLGDPAPTVSTHRVIWVADMVWQGDEISGTYTVTDEWSWTMAEESDQGTLVASGTLAGTLLAE